MLVGSGRAQEILVASKQGFDVSVVNPGIAGLTPDGLPARKAIGVCEPESLQGS